MTFEQVLAQYGFPLAALLIVVVTGARKVWVWGWTLRDAEQREAQWREIALKALNVGERVIEK
jgi:NhaP-type Na+/H+ or K+/H+ antiporter